MMILVSMVREFSFYVPVSLHHTTEDSIAAWASSTEAITSEQFYAQYHFDERFFVNRLPSEVEMKNPIRVRQYFNPRDYKELLKLRRESNRLSGQVKVLVQPLTRQIQSEPVLVTSEDLTRRVSLYCPVHLIRQSSERLSEINIPEGSESHYVEFLEPSVQSSFGNFFGSGTNKVEFQEGFFLHRMHIAKGQYELMVKERQTLDKGHGLITLSFSPMF